MVLRLLGLGDRIGMKILTIHSTDGHRLSINKVRIGVGGRRHPSPLCMLTLFCCLGYTFVNPAIAFYFLFTRVLRAVVVYRIVHGFLVENKTAFNRLMAMNMNCIGYIVRWLLLLSV